MRTDTRYFKALSKMTWIMALLLVVFTAGCDRDHGKAVPPTPPTVTSVTPANATPGVAVNRIVTATFSEPMSGATITAPGTFIVTGPFVSPVTGTVTYDVPSRTATFTPAVNLLNNTTYNATISTGAENPAGTALAGPFAWSFSTAVTPDTTAPTVVFTVPLTTPFQANVPTNTKIVATFNEAMDPATIIASNVTVTGPSGAVSGAVTYAAGSNAMTFTPASNLATSATYTVTIKGPAGVKDQAGNLMAANYPWSFTTAAAPDTTAPQVSSTNPLDLATNVPINKIISATFTEAMDPLTITTAQYTLTDGVNPVIGTVAYDVPSNIATFTPLSPLAFSTTYTALISNGATDLAGNALAIGVVPNPWSFTTGLAPVIPPVVPLGAAATFGSFGGGAGMTNQGILTVINGDIGTTGASTLMTGFHDLAVPYTSPSPGPAAGCTYTETPLNIGLVNGTIYTAPPPPTITCPNEGTALTFSIATQAAADALTAYNQLAGMPAGSDPGAGSLGGLTLAPGVYTAAGGSFLLQGSDLTLDAQGDPNALFVFQMASTLTVGGPGATAPRSVILINGAQAKNVFWQVGSAATINAAGGGTMVGTIIAQAGAAFSTAGNVNIVTLNGRAIGLNASVTLVNTVINVPAP